MSDDLETDRVTPGPGQSKPRSVQAAGIQMQGVVKSAQRVLELLRRRPITTIANATVQLGFTAPTVRSAVEDLESLSIVREITGKQRDRVYVYDRYVKILDEGTEPLPHR